MRKKETKSNFRKKCLKSRSGSFTPIRWFRGVSRKINPMGKKKTNHRKKQPAINPQKQGNRILFVTKSTDKKREI